MKEWIKWALVAFLSLLAAHFYAQYRLANMMAVGAMQSLQQSNDYINNQCTTILTRQGFQVIKTPPPAPEPEEEDREKK